MPIQACHPPEQCRPWAELCCHIGLECSRAVCHAAARGHCLALSPGAVTEDTSLCAGAQISHITIPACKEYAAEQIDLPVPPFCRTADGPPACIYTTTTKWASACAVRAGDVVTYQVTFTNHASIQLDMVCIYDDIQEGVIPGSIRPAPGPGETLRTGISMGKLDPGQSAVLTYDVIASFSGSRPMASRTWVRYRCTDPCGCSHRGTSGCRSCAVFQLPDRRPICRCVRRQFSIRDFSQLRYVYVYHRGVDCFKSSCGCNLVIKFGIAVKYIDCRGKKRGKFFEDSIEITGLDEDFEPSESRIRLTDLICLADDPGHITAKFRVTCLPGCGPPCAL